VKNRGCPKTKGVKKHGVITVKVAGCLLTRWRGDYQDKKQYWFPANFVVEIESEDDSVDNTPLGSLQKGAIDVTSCMIGELWQNIKMVVSILL